MKKCIQKALLFFLVLSLLFCTVQAADIWDVGALLDKYAAENVSQLEQIDRIISAELKESDDTNEIASFDLEHAYRVVRMQNLPLTIYNRTDDFEATLTDDTQWKVPVTSIDGEHGFFCLKETESDISWQYTAFGEGADLFYFSKEKLEQAVSSSELIKSPIISLQFIHSYMYATLFVRIFTENDEYLIPYSLYENEFGIQNGTVYTVPDLMRILTEHIDEQYYYDHPNEMMGIPLRKELIKQAWIKAAIFAVPALLIAGCVVFVILFRRRHRRKA